MSLTMTVSGGDPAASPLARFSWLRAAVAFADEAGPVVRDALKQEAPFGQGSPRPGRMRGSIRYERHSSAGGVTMLFTAPVPYTPYVLRGTGPHLITAKAARALHWRGRGGIGEHFARSVHHPGTKANPFNERAVARVAEFLQRSFREAVEASMEGA